MRKIAQTHLSICVIIGYNKEDYKGRFKREKSSVILEKTK